MSDQRDGCGCLLLIAGLLVYFALSHRIGELRQRLEQVEIQQELSGNSALGKRQVRAGR